MKTKDKGNIIIALLASLTLGLAPFVPEPHIVGKLRWVAGGGVGMELQDYGDLLMHGLPWLVLIYFVGKYVKSVFSGNDDKESASPK
jgi:hypothetical protein